MLSPRYSPLIGHPQLIGPGSIQPDVGIRTSSPWEVFRCSWTATDVSKAQCYCQLHLWEWARTFVCCVLAERWLAWFWRRSHHGSWYSWHHCRRCCSSPCSNQGQTSSAVFSRLEDDNNWNLGDILLSWNDDVHPSPNVDFTAVSTPRYELNPAVPDKGGSVIGLSLRTLEALQEFEQAKTRPWNWRQVGWNSWRRSTC